MVVERTCLHDGKNNISLVFNGCESHGCDHYDHEVECLRLLSFDAEMHRNRKIWSTYPIGRCRQRICRCPNTQGYDLSRVQPSHTQPSNCEESIENEEKEGGYDSCAFAGIFVLHCV